MRSKPEFKASLLLYHWLALRYIFTFIEPFPSYLRLFPFCKVFISVEAEDYDVFWIRWIRRTDNVYPHVSFEFHGFMNYSIHPFLEFAYLSFLCSPSYYNRDWAAVVIAIFLV